MSVHWSERGGRLIVAGRAIREAGPLLKGYIRLARAETALAAGSVKGFGVFLSVAVIGFLVVLITLVAALFAWLVQTGHPVWEALLWIAIPGAVVTGLGLFGVIRRYEHFTLPQTRKRVRMLLELIDEDR